MKTGVNSTERDFNQCIAYGEETAVGTHRPGWIQRVMGEAADARNAGRLRDVGSSEVWSYPQAGNFRLAKNKIQQEG